MADDRLLTLSVTRAGAVVGSVVGYLSQQRAGLSRDPFATPSGNMRFLTDGDVRAGDYLATVTDRYRVSQVVPTLTARLLALMTKEL